MEHFPDFHVEDKVCLESGSVDRTPKITKVHVRKKRAGGAM